MLIMMKARSLPRPSGEIDVERGSVLASPTSSEEIIAKCMGRLKFEMNTHLLSQEELSKILQQQKCRPK